MKSKHSDAGSWRLLCRDLLAIGCAALLVPGNVSCALLASQKPDATSPDNTAQPPAATAQPPTAPPPDTTAAQSAAEATAVKLPPEQLESLVAPIALYPDPLLAQTLVASTYPLEIIQLQQWLAKNPNLKDKELADAVAKEPWDPSIQSMAAFPDVVKRLADDIQWTTDLGNAFLAQQSEVMDAVQRMRQKAKEKGALESNEQQTVETKVIEEKTVIVVEPANPEVIYVPSYSPTVVYGAPVYPYPPIYYPPYPPGAAFMSFSIGVMWGAAFWGGSCCGCGWGGNNVNINVDNNFNNINRGDRGDRGDRGNRAEPRAGDRAGDRGGRGGAGAGGGNWQHNPQHRGAAPYADKATANKYGGSARGESPGNRQQAGTRQQPSAGNRAASPGAGNRASAPSASNRAAGGASASRAGGDPIGGRNIQQRSSSSKAGGFGGGSSYSGSSARASGSRGASSMGSRGAPRGGGGGRRR
ncbi:MAG TPA: DUF3300 domain-containing protein [Candidatus Krumholzibacteria bacterium]|nr:DUF3300 domain-containing protein [Candidatus Krumholzibacteria bacterium]